MFTGVIRCVIILFPLGGVVQFQSNLDLLGPLTGFAFPNEVIALLCISLSKFDAHIQEIWIGFVNGRKSLNSLVPIHPSVTEPVEVGGGDIYLLLQVLVFGAELPGSLQIPYPFFDVPLLHQLPAKVDIGLKQQSIHLGWMEILVQLFHGLQGSCSLGPLLLIEVPFGLQEHFPGSLSDRARSSSRARRATCICNIRIDLLDPIVRGLVGRIELQRQGELGPRKLSLTLFEVLFSKLYVLCDGGRLLHFALLEPVLEPHSSRKQYHRQANHEGEPNCQQIVHIQPGRRFGAPPEQSFPHYSSPVKITCPSGEISFTESLPKTAVKVYQP